MYYRTVKLVECIFDCTVQYSILKYKNTINYENILVQYSVLLMNTQQHCNINDSQTRLLQQELEHIINNGQLI